MEMIQVLPMPEWMEAEEGTDEELLGPEGGARHDDVVEADACRRLGAHDLNG